MTKESFIFYASFDEAIRELNDKQRLKIYDAICDYALRGIEPDFKGVEKAVFSLIIPQIKANHARYENGKKGGAPKGNHNARKVYFSSEEETTAGCVSTENGNNLKTTKKQPKNNQKQPNENVNVNENVNNIPPTVNAYAQEGNGAKMAAFLAKYPLINPDSHIAGYDMDFELLTACFERSKKYLARKPHDLSWVAKNYHRIISGAFDDKWDDDGELTPEEIEANRRAFEEKYGATAGD